MMKWYFPEHEAGRTIYNPLAAEHFSEKDDDWKPGEDLVRECIQNSIDACQEDSVHVSFLVRASGAMTQDMGERWFGSLWPHLQSQDCKLAEVTPKPTSGGFVMVEDFGTTGLEGDIEQSGLRDQSNRFFNFFRAEGLSGNDAGGTAGGSWGVGKSVFNRCSRINSFLALSRRHADGSLILMGRSVLRHHRVLQSGEYEALGLCGEMDPSRDRLVRPVRDLDTIKSFARDFGIKRPVGMEESVPGLSVVIPYADSAITADGLKDIVVRQYFHTILAGRLSVRIGDGRTSVDLTEDSIERYAQEHHTPEVQRILRLSRWSQSEEAQNAYVLDEPSSDDAPDWDDGLLRPDEPAFAELSQRFERGDPVAIRVRVHVHAKNKKPERASFTVHLQRDLDGTGYRPVFVRGWIVVPNARQRSVRNHSLFALITIEEGPLAVMLRAAEPPAHTSWDPNTANFKGRYEFGKQTIEFVKDAPRFLAEALSSADTERDFDVWADLFPAPHTEGQRKGEGTGRKGRRKTPTAPIDPPAPRRKSWRMEAVDSGGFFVTRDNPALTSLPGELRIVVAYDNGTSKPDKSYNKADFRIEKLQRRVVGATEAECKDNLMIVHPISDDFHVEVTGFDANRDLFVRVRSFKADGGGDE